MVKFDIFVNGVNKRRAWFNPPLLLDPEVGESDCLNLLDTYRFV